MRERGHSSTRKPKIRKHFTKSEGLKWVEKYNKKVHEAVYYIAKEMSHFNMTKAEGMMFVDRVEIYKIYR